MKGRAIIPLAVGLVVGVLAIKMFTDVLKKARGSSTTPMVTVVVASADIGSTMEITGNLVETRSVPQALLPKLAIQDPKEVVGRVAALTIPKGMPLVPRLLAPAGTPAGMAVRIKDGYRAVAVKIDESAGVAGWIKPGSLIDVVAVMQTQNGGHRNTISKVILENVEVLAVGQDIGATGDVEAELAKSVTVQVRPEDVPRLHLAATRGTIRLAMRNQRDFKIAGVGQTTDNELLGSSRDGDSLAKAGSSPKEQSILGRLFHKQPKVSSAATDKGTGGQRTVEPMAVQTAVPVAEQRWQVELLNGADSKALWFDGSAKDARRVNDGAGERNQMLPVSGVGSPVSLSRSRILGRVQVPGLAGSLGVTRPTESQE